MVLIFVFGACQTKTEYQQVKERELASGETFNDLFLGLHFGMGRKDFFGTCWELNKQGVLVNGANALQIQYKPDMPSKKPTHMFFYPEFEDNQLYFMPMEFIYPSWFPGNDEYSNDKLMEDVQGLLEDWYGDGFFEVMNNSKTVRAVVKIDGNRLIRIFKKNVSTIRVEMLDLRVKDISDMIRPDDTV